MERRQFVAGTASVGVLGIVGCVGGSGGSRSPESTVEAFFDAAAAGDVETQETLLHPESEIEPTGEDVELTITEIEPVSLETLAAEPNSSLSADDIEQHTQQLDDQIQEIGAADYSHVSYSFETEEYGAQSGYLILVEEDGEWLLYRFVEEIKPGSESAREAGLPQLSFQFYFNSESKLTITHGGGETVDVSRLSVEVEDTAVLSGPGSWEATGWSGTVQTGDALTLTDSSGTEHAGERIAIVWSPPEGGGETVMTSHDWPAIEDVP